MWYDLRPISIEHTHTHTFRTNSSINYMANSLCVGHFESHGLFIHSPLSLSLSPFLSISTSKSTLQPNLNLISSSRSHEYWDCAMCACALCCYYFAWLNKHHMKMSMWTYTFTHTDTQNVFQTECYLLTNLTTTQCKYNTPLKFSLCWTNEWNQKSSLVYDVVYGLWNACVCVWNQT